ncbi:hypothetical protein AB0D32_13735 [Micromonospora sp. NPDC048170]|uniref:hypothetical protein n=1 Tax=Micromonospora sp. NPDC048170 TaxID=3154819 RepID=UPI003408076A
MPNIAEHANMVSNSQFEDLSEESRARKMNDGEPLGLLPVIVATALITAVGSLGIGSA